MRNRAKCKLCLSIIESTYRNDYVTCKCGEISIDGGMDYCRCIARDWNNFLRVDDEGNEIIITVKEKDEKESVSSPKPDRRAQLDMLDEMVKSYESLPQDAMLTPISHYDFASALLLLSSILRASNDCRNSTVSNDLDKLDAS